MGRTKGKKFISKFRPHTVSRIEKKIKPRRSKPEPKQIEETQIDWRPQILCYLPHPLHFPLSYIRNRKENDDCAIEEKIKNLSPNELINEYPEIFDPEDLSTVPGVVDLLHLVDQLRKAKGLTMLGVVLPTDIDSEEISEKKQVPTDANSTSLHTPRIFERLEKKSHSGMTE